MQLTSSNKQLSHIALKGERKFSSVFFLEISHYDKDGVLLAAGGYNWRTDLHCCACENFQTGPLAAWRQSQAPARRRCRRGAARGHARGHARGRQSGTGPRPPSPQTPRQHPRGRGCGWYLRQDAMSQVSFTLKTERGKNMLYMKNKDTHCASTFTPSLFFIYTMPNRISLHLKKVSILVLIPLIWILLFSTQCSHRSSVYNVELPSRISS